MSDLLTASLREQLWHIMRSDLVRFVPELTGNALLMCCSCGRFLPQDCFDLEHLIPQQALKADPPIVRANPVTPKNVRAGNLLLCKKRLVYRGKIVSNNGCNSWKGRFFDKAISHLVSDNTIDPSNKPVTETHIIAGLVLGYLALVAEFGYVVVLMQSGLLMRRQFFSPKRFVPDMPIRHQMLLGGKISDAPPEHPVWSKPFSFSLDNGTCYVGARNFSVNVPVSRNPREPIATHVRHVPLKFRLHPNFKTLFD